MSETPLQKWRESLQEKYGNPERSTTYNYEYQEWRDGMKNMLASFQEEIEIRIRKTKEEYELDYQKIIKIQKQQIVYENDEKHKHTKHFGNLENPKKRKFEN